jgi:hypothetical protein
MSQLLTLNQLTSRHPAFTLDALRSLIFRRLENGLNESGAIVRIGRRVLVDADAFDRWLASRRHAA